MSPDQGGVDRTPKADQDLAGGLEVDHLGLGRFLDVVIVSVYLALVVVLSTAAGLIYGRIV